MPTQEQINEILQKYNITATTIENFDTGGVNAEFVYKIFDKNNKYLLKSVREERVEWTENSAKLIKHLKERGFLKTAESLTNSENGFVTKFDSKYWTLQEFVEGKQLRNNEISTEEAKSFGETVAELHKAYLNDTSILDEEYVRTEISYKDMFEQEQHEKMIEAMELLREMDLPNEDKTLLVAYWEEYLKTRKYILETLEEIDEEKFNKGITHRDLNKGNVLFLDNKAAAIIDWEEVAFGNIIQDVAYTTSQYLLNLEDKENTAENIKAFIEGYESVIQLSEEEKRFIPTLVEILLVRATRWWGKRYLLLIQEGASKNKLEKHRGGFRKTLNNWLNDKQEYSSIFSSIFV